jgi:SAM-dependent methyltransferase
VTKGATNAELIAAMYAPTAGDYEEIWAPLLRPFGLRLLDMLSLEGARRVLDLGCGVGRLLPDISERAPGALVVGCDLTEGMLSLANPRFSRVVMDALQPAFVAGAFDAVVSAFMLFHVPDPPSALERIREALRPGGKVALAVWGTGGVCPAIEAFNEVLDGADVPADPTAEGQRDGEELVNSPQKMLALLSAAGFRESSAETATWTKPWDLDAFIEWRIRMGPGRRRLELLPPQLRTTVVAQARERLASLGPDDLVDHDVVVLASGVAPR